MYTQQISAADSRSLWKMPSGIRRPPGKAMWFRFMNRTVKP